MLYFQTPQTIFNISHPHLQKKNGLSLTVLILFTVNFYDVF